MALGRRNDERQGGRSRSRSNSGPTSERSPRRTRICPTASSNGSCSLAMKPRTARSPIARLTDQLRVAQVASCRKAVKRLACEPETTARPGGTHDSQPIPPSVRRRPATSPVSASISSAWSISLPCIADAGRREGTGADLAGARDARESLSRPEEALTCDFASIHTNSVDCATTIHRDRLFPVTLTRTRRVTPSSSWLGRIQRGRPGPRRYANALNAEGPERPAIAWRGYRNTDSSCRCGTS